MPRAGLSAILNRLLPSGHAAAGGIVGDCHVFQDRTQAGRQLARALAAYKDHQPVVLALPRGGVPVAAQVAEALKAPLDLILVRKIGVPFQPELAMGAVVDGGKPLIVRNEDVIGLAGIDGGRIQEGLRQRACRDRAAARAISAAASAPRSRPDGDRNRDGVATGATTRAALRATRLRGPKKLVLAVPVAPTDSLQAARRGRRSGLS